MSQGKKKQLISRMGSKDNQLALSAVEELRKRGWLTDGSLARAYLSRANLQGANLQEANLHGADLSSAWLWNTNLHSANLDEVNLNHAPTHHSNLEGTKIRNANLQAVNLAGSNLRDADVSNTDLQSAWLIQADLQNVNLTGAQLDYADVFSANLEKAILERSSLKDAILERANLKRASLKNANLQGADLENANLLGADLQDANLDGAYLLGVRMSGANLKKAKFSDQTKLPDNTYWKYEIDMSRFTNPASLRFWQEDLSEYRISLSYLLEKLERAPGATLVAPLRPSNESNVAWLRVHRLRESILRKHPEGMKYLIRQYEIPQDQYQLYLEGYDIAASDVAVTDHQLYASNEESLEKLLNEIVGDLKTLKRERTSRYSFPP